jgi:phosphohistidine phosphatase
MSRQLILLRHAKSSWESEAETDFERPLAKRGIKSLKIIGKWLNQHHVSPDLIISSTATRARQTIEPMVDYMDYAARSIQWSDEVYMAGKNELLKIITAADPDINQLMLVGHNPGIEDLLLYLCQDNVELTSGGKVMPTCTVAILSTNKKWHDFSEKCCQLVSIARPKEIQE